MERERAQVRRNKERREPPSELREANDELE
jgi:hypothetical protein